MTTNHPALSNWVPAWSADGRWLSLAAWSWQGGDRLVVVDTQQGERHSIMQVGATYSSPTWSPIGAQLVYEQRTDQVWELWLYDLESKQHRLLVAVRGDARRPLWLPDGERLLYRSNRFGNWDIFMLSLADPGTSIRLTTGHQREYAPAWRPCALAC